MADDIIGGEVSDAHAADALQDIQRFSETGLDTSGQVSLRAVAGDHHFRAVAEAGEEHLHLLAGGVLSLVEDDEGFAERAAAHIGEGSYLDDSLGHELLIDVVTHQLGESIVERSEIGVYLVREVAGQEAEALAGLYSRSGEDDAAHLVSAEGKDSHGDSQECLAAAGGAFGERHIVALYGGDVFLLAQSSCAYRFAAVGGEQHIAKETVEGFFLAVLYHLDGIAHLLCREAGASPDEGEQGGDGRDGASDPMGGAGDGQYISVGNEAAVKAFPQYLQQLVSPA